MSFARSMIGRIGALVALVACGVVAAQERGSQGESNTAFDPAAAAKWPLERLERKDGKVYEGVVLPGSAGDNRDAVSFAIVRRPAGRPMHLAVFPIKQDQIAKIDRLPDAERALLLDRIERFRKQRAEEKIEISRLELRAGDAGGPQWLYDSGPWFRLESWTNERMTRRTIVRIEQIFTAYSEILPMRAKPERPLRILLYGSMKNYADFQKGLGQSFENPAVYVPPLNVLAAGSELSAYAARLEDVERRHAAIRAQYEQMSAGMPDKLKKLESDLEKNGVPVAERRAAIGAARRKWKEELEDVARRMGAIDRGNEAQFKAVTDDMLTRLCHEAFHAYLENFVYPHEKHDVPIWLNEGLAQVFEDGLLDVGTLRFDAPSGKRLSALQDDLRAAVRLSLAELLTADGRSFLVTHPTTAKTSKRHYLYSWGLAYYLAVREPVLESARLEAYVNPREQESNAVVRFEALVGMPLDQFEAKWRAEMLTMKAPEK